MAANMNTTRKLYTVALVSFLLAAGFPLLALNADALHTSTTTTIANNTLRFTQADYDTVVTTYEGIGQTAHIVIKRTDADITDSRDLLTGVTIQSTRGTAASSPAAVIDLLETGPKTGVFVGSFGFRDAATHDTAGNEHPFLGRILGKAKIGVTPTPSATNTITVTPPTGVAAGTVSWKPTADATFLAFDQLGAPAENTNTVVFGYSGTIVLQVTDADRNRITSGAGARETYTSVVRATSTSDPQGEHVILQETGDNTGIFQGTIQLEATPVLNNGKVFVRNSDFLFATYTDPTDLSGFEAEITLPFVGKSWTFRTVATGVPAMDRSGPNFYYGTTGTDPTGADRATIVVLDPDRDTGARQDRVIVTAKSIGDATGVQVELLELGGQTGFFVGTLHFTNGASVDSPSALVPDVLKVGPGGGARTDLITIEYADTADDNNQPGVRTAFAGWSEIEDGLVTLGTNPTTRLLSGTTNLHQVRVQDWDANINPSGLDSVTVIVASTSEPAGIPLLLTEASENTGDFFGTIQFTTGSSSASLKRIKVADGDRVTVLYEDARSANGFPAQFRANGAMPFGSPVTWRTPATGTVELDAATYYFQGSGAPIETVANVFVVDPDQNDPLRADTVGVTIVTIVPTGQTPKSIVLTLGEIGIDSGVFHGELMFTASPSSTTELPIGTGVTTFRAEYLDPIASDGNNRLAATAPSTFVNGPSTPVIRLEAEKNRIGGSDTHFERVDTVYIQPVVSPAAEQKVLVAAYAATAAAAPSSITVSSSRCPAGITVSTVADGLQRRVGELILRALDPAPANNANGGCPGGNVLGVLVQGTATTTLTLSASGVQSFPAVVRPASAELLSFFDKDQVTPLTRARGESVAVYQRVTGGHYNEDRTARDIVPVTLMGTREGLTTFLYLVENGADSGQFDAAFGFTLLNPSQSALNAAKVVAVDAENLRRGNLADTGGAEDPLGSFGGAVQDVVAGSIGPVFVSNGAPFASLTRAPGRGVYWSPASDGTLVADKRTIFGSSETFILTLAGDDNAAQRVEGEAKTAAASNPGRSYTTTSSFVSGTELVFAAHSHQRSHMGDATTEPADLQVTTLPSSTEAAEPISDRSRDGIRNCADVTLTVTITNTLSPLGNPGTITCESISPTAGTVTYRLGNCATGDTCAVTIAYQYRARAGVTTTGSPALANSVFEYTRATPTASSILLGATPAASTQILIDYTPSTRTVGARSLTVGGEVKDQATLTLTYGAATATLPEGFRATIGTEQAQQDQSLLLTGPAATRLEFNYADPFTAYDGKAGSADPTNYRANILRSEWLPSVNGDVAYTNPAGTQVTTGPVFGPCVPVQVTEPDANRGPSFDFIVLTARRSNLAAQTVTIPLRETTPTSGVFRGIIPLALDHDESLTNGGTPTPPINKCDDGRPDSAHIQFPPEGGLLLSTYSDPHGGTGLTTPRDATINWRPSAGATVTLTHVGSTNFATESDPVRGDDGGVVVRVTDPDANQNANVLDTTKATLFSEVSSIEVTLTETGVNTANFVSSPVRFKPLASGPANRLLAGFGDRISVLYVDPRDEVGNPVTKTTAPTKWVQAFTGDVKLDYSLYIGNAFLTAAGAKCKIGATWRPGEISSGMLVLSDGDFNLQPGVVETLSPTTMASILQFGQLDTGGNVISTTRPTFVSMVETGANTGVFVAVFGFKTGATPTHEDLDAGGETCARVPISNSQRLGAAYTDSFTQSGSPGSIISRTDARWFDSGFGIVTLDKNGYRQGTAASTDLVQPHVVGITLSDANFATTPSTTLADTMTVRASSQADTNGVSVTLTETGLDTRVFKGSVSLTGSTGSGTLKVNSNDVVTVLYQDANPDGPRTSTAPVSGDSVAPKTTLVTDPLPVKKEDGNLWIFHEKPTISFTTDDSQYLETQYKLGTSCTSTTAPTEVKKAPPAFELAQGCYRLLFASVDKFTNKETPEQDYKILVDLADPTQVVSGLQATAAAGGDVLVSWTAPAIVNDPFELCSYAVFRDAQTTPIGSATGTGCATVTTTFRDDTLDDENTHTYRVAVVDQAGRVGDLSGTVSVIPDKTVPQVSSLAATPTTFDVRAPPSNGVRVTVLASDTNLDRVVALIVDPTGKELVNVTLASAGGTFSGTLDVSSIADACSCILRVVATDKAGNEGTEELAFPISGPDLLPPEAQFPSLPNDQLVQGSAYTVTVADKVALGYVKWKLDNGAFQDVAVSGASVTFTVPAASLTLGSHTIAIEAEDLAMDQAGNPTPNKLVASKTILVVSQPTGPGGLPASYFLPTTATPRSDGTVLVAWTTPVEVKNAGIGGYQVWRAASPFVLIANVTDPDQQSFVDRTAEAGKTYRYVVTFFATGGFGDLFQVPGWPGSDDAVQGSAPVVPEESGIPAWIWIAIAAVAVIVVAVLVAVAIASSRRATGPQQQVVQVAPPPTDEAPAQEVASGERHVLKCPQCATRFEVFGKKPIVTACPNCGKKGILR